MGQLPTMAINRMNQSLLFSMWPPLKPDGILSLVGGLEHVSFSPIVGMMIQSVKNNQLVKVVYSVVYKTA